MAARSQKNGYTEFEKEVDIQKFRDSILNYFALVPDPRESRRVVYRLEHIFFIILSAALAGANSIHQITVFSKAKAKWTQNLIGIQTTPAYGVFWWVFVRLKPEFLRDLLKGWLASLPEDLRNQILAIDGF